MNFPMKFLKELPWGLENLVNTSKCARELTSWRPWLPKAAPPGARPVRAARLPRPLWQREGAGRNGIWNGYATESFGRRKMTANLCRLQRFRISKRRLRPSKSKLTSQVLSVGSVGTLCVLTPRSIHTHVAVAPNNASNNQDENC